MGLVAGCGRIAFDEDSDAGAPAQSDVAGDTQASHTCGPFGAPVLLPGPLNVALDSEWSPEISDDGLTIYYYCFRPGGPGPPDIWRASRASPAADFDTPVPMNEVSSSSVDNSPSVTDDELVMAFASTRQGGYDLYLATRTNKTDPFSMPIRSTGLSSPSVDDAPDLSGDGLRIVFNSNRGPNGDLYMANRTDRTSDFDNVTPIDELNTGDVEDSPALSKDELELFFVSDRPGGLGLMDIWRATRSTRNDPFSVIENVTAVNSAGDDFGPSLSSDGTQLYFSYNAMTDGAGAPSQVWVATRTCQ